jgi:archaellum component FlaC
MDKAELLREFTTKVDQFEKFQSFIQKAKEQTGKFAAAVVTKVIKDNDEKCEQLMHEIQPLTAHIERVVGELKTARDQALEASKESQFRLEELELRLAIGDLSEEDFNAEAADYKSVVETTDAKVAEIDGERTRFQEVLVQWQRVAGQAIAPSSSSRTATPEPVPAKKHTPPPRPAEPTPQPPPRDVAPAHAPTQEDLEIEEELDQTPAPAEGRAVPPPAEAEPVIEEDLADPFAINSNFDQDLEVPVVPEPDAPEFADEPEEREERPRRSVLLYQEGTAEEQIYPFTGEVLSLGRGRDNDVQVKNDSKVSRYHCKLFRRGPNFYIEDNKSANGTLVNGELITERRLFGGEEVIIGETFFRFRILD